MQTYSGSTGELSYFVEIQNCPINFILSEKPKCFTGLQVGTMLRFIDEYDSGRENETERGYRLDWELCSSDEMSDVEESEQFDDTQSIVHVGDLQTANINVGTYSGTWFDDSGLITGETSSTHETARDGTKRKFMEFGVETRWRLQLKMSKLSNQIYHTLLLERQIPFLVLLSFIW